MRKRAVRIIGAVRSREAYDRYKDFSRSAPAEIRDFRTPVLSFDAETYATMTPLKTFKGKYDGVDAPKLFKFQCFCLNSTVAKATWERVTEPPLTKKLSMDEIRGFIGTPYTCDYPSHTQSVEHGVAAVSRAVKQRRTERTQLIQVRQAVAAIKRNPGPITKRRKLNDCE